LSEYTASAPFTASRTKPLPTQALIWWLGAEAGVDKPLCEIGYASEAPRAGIRSRQWAAPSGCLGSPWGSGSGRRAQTVADPPRMVQHLPAGALSWPRRLAGLSDPSASAVMRQPLS